MNLTVVCSHLRGEEHLTLCCVSPVEDGKAIAIQLTGTVVEVSDDPDDRNHEFPSVEAAIQALRSESYPHA